MKRALLGFFSVVILLVIGLVAAPNFIDWSKYKLQGLEKAKEVTGYDISVGGDFALAFLPAPHITAEQVSVINPAAGDDPLATFDKLSVSVALAPLLKGAVQVSEITLIKPNFDIRFDKDGKGNWVSPEIEAMSAKKEQPAAGAKEAPPVSFDKITIENGNFRLSDVRKGGVTEVQDINLTLKADSLQGPFDADGSVVFGGQKTEFSAKTSAIDTVANALSVNLKAEQGAYNLVYGGAVTLSEPFEAQGETELRADSLPGFAKAVALKGFLSASPEKAAFKDATLSVGDQTYTGTLAVDLKPLKVAADFDGKGILDLDALMPKKAAADKKDGDVNAVLDILPNTLTLPQAFEADIKLGSAGVIYNKALIKNVDIAISKSGKTFKANVKAAEIPGRGPAVVDADLSFAEKSVSKTGSEVYSGPSLNAVIQANTQNTGETIKAFTGKNDIPVLSTARIGKFYIKAASVPGKLSFDESIVNLDDLKLQLAGSLQRGKGKNPLLKADVVANSLNFDTLMPKKEKPAAAATNSDPTAGLRNLSVPYDVDFNVSVNQAVMNGQNITGLKAAGSLRPDVLSLTKLAASDFGGAAFDIAGKIGSLKALSGLDFTVKGSAQDPYKVAKTFKVDTSKLPQNLGAVSVNSKISGAFAELDTNSDVSALGGDFILQGKLQNPHTAMKFSDLAVQVKHPNMAQLLKNVGASAPAYASFSKPIDFYTKLDTDGKVTNLSAIKATLAGTNMSGNLRYDATAAKPAVSGALKFGRLELVSKGAAAGGGSAAASAGGGKWSADPINSGFLHAVNADFDVAAESILYEKWDMKAPSLKMTLNNGALDIKDLKAGLFDGQIAVQGKVSSASASAPIALNTTANITDVNIESLAYALSSNRKIQAKGKASLSVNATGTGASQKALVSSLNGDAKLDGNNFVLEGFDLAGLASALLDSNKPLPRIQQLVGASTSGGTTAFDTINGSYTIKNGVVSINSMGLNGPEAAITSRGDVNLPLWTINTVHTIKLVNAPSIAPFDVTIKGNLNNPGNTFGKGLFESYYQQKLQEKVLEKAPDLLGDSTTKKLQQFGILPQGQQPANDNSATEPAAGDDAAAQPAQQQKAPTVEDQAQEAIQGVLKGLLQ